MAIEMRGAGRAGEPQRRYEWHRALQIYVAVAALGNLAWEILQLPLYTIWTTAPLKLQAFAVLHCTGGDVLIAITMLTVALITVGPRDWPAAGSARVLLVTLVLGVGYTIFSEWLNVVVRASWAYSPLMPVVPILNTGLSPLLQWIVIPVAALWSARRWARPE